MIILEMLCFFKGRKMKPCGIMKQTLITGKWQLSSFWSLHQLHELRPETRCRFSVSFYVFRGFIVYRVLWHPFYLIWTLALWRRLFLILPVGRSKLRKVQWLGPECIGGWILEVLDQRNAKSSSNLKTYGSGISHETWSLECNSLTIHLKQNVQYPLPHSSQSIYFLTYYYRPGSSFAISAHLFPSLLCAW